MPGNRLVRFPAYIMKKFIQNSIYYASSFLLLMILVYVTSMKK